MSQSPARRSYRHLVSVKGVCFQADRVLLLRNERDEWELPGGTSTSEVGDEGEHRT